MKIIITESQYNKAIDWYLTNAFEPHEEKQTKKYPNSTFWIKDNEIIAEIEKSMYFWIKRDIWNNFSDLFSLQYDEIQSVIKQWLEEHYELGELTPYLMRAPFLSALEEHYELGELTPLTLRPLRRGRWRRIINWDN